MESLDAKERDGGKAVSLKVVICDDEMGMRLVIQKVIARTEGFYVVGEAANGESLLSLVNDLKPQVIFLDVEMPGMDGLECAKRIMEEKPKTKIIFATAYEEFMSQAFQVYAFDYIVKPFKLERINQTLERIRLLERGERPDEDSLASEEGTVDKIVAHEAKLDKIIVKNKEGISFVNMKDIIIIERENRSTVIYTSDESYITSEALGDIEEKLDKTLFFRSHKSYIINLSKIHKIYPYGRWTYTVELKNTDRDALLTHDKYEELKELFGLGGSNNR